MGNVNESYSSWEIRNEHQTDETYPTIERSGEIHRGVKSEDGTFEQYSLLWVVKDIIRYPKLVISLGEVRTKRGTKLSIELHKNPSDVHVIIVAGDFNNETKITLEASILNPFVDTRTAEFTDKNTTAVFLCPFTIGEKDYLLGGRHLVLYCEIKSMVEKGQVNISNEDLFHSHFLLGMRALLEETPFYDSVMRVKGKDFLCHRAILACRSQYFKELFQKNSGKTEENRFILQDVEPNIFEKVLKFVYTGELDVPQDNILQMLAAADRFHIDILKDACEEKLHSCFTYGNMLTMYKVARDFDLQYLKQRALLGLATFEKYVETDTLDTLSSHPAGPQLSFNYNALDCIDKAVWKTNETCKVFQPASDDCSLPRLGGKFPIADAWYVTEEPIILKGVWRFSIPHKTTVTHSGIQDKRDHYFSDRERGLKCMMEVHIEGSKSATSERICSDPDTKTELQMFELNLVVVSSPYSTADIDYKFFFEHDTEEVFIVTGCQQFEKGKKLQILRKITSEVPSFNGGTIRIHYSFWVRKLFVHLKRPVDSNNNVMKDLSALQAEGMYTDLTIRVQETEFHCHKAIVGHWSPLLRRKIEGSSETNVISLDDIDPQSFKKFLSFVYSGRFNATDIESGHLLPCIQMFEVKSLQIPYEEYLMNNLTVINVLTVCEYSEKCSMALQKACVEFVAKHFAEIINLHESNGQLENARLIDAVLQQLRNTSRD